MIRLFPLFIAVLFAHAPARASRPSPEKSNGSNMVKLKAEAFPLEEVRLLDGPFKHAMELDRKYLHSLDPDRLLHNFRVTAGLPSTAQPYGGWEKPDCEVRGHFTGHYLSACARMYACAGDVELMRRAEYMVAEMAKCQAKVGTGYLSAYPVEFIDRVEALKPVWAPWYTLHKILAGLLDVYRYCGDKQALHVATRFCDWIEKRTDRLSDEQMEKMLGNEHGGMNEVLASISAAAREPRYLKLALRFNHHAVLDPLMRQEDKLTGLHANTQIPKLIGAAREYELTGDPKLATAARFFWETVTKERSYVIGGHSDGEVFSPKEHLSEHLSADTTETCNTYNMLKLTTHLFTWDPEVEYADYYERALYNHILASQNPRTGMMCYYVPLKSGASKVYNTPDDSFWCCTGTGVENHTRYGDAIYFHEGNRALYVNLFVASELQWKEKGLSLLQETRFPEDGKVRLKLTCKRPSRLSLYLRHPGWAGTGFSVALNGEDPGKASSPGSYVEITRTWKTGDVVELSLPMSLHTEGFRDNPRRRAFLCGPIVLASPVSGPTAVPSIVSDQTPDADSLLRPAPGGTLHFAADPKRFLLPGGESPKSAQFLPFYAMHDRPYEVYWDVMTREQWQKTEDERRIEAEKRRALEARTIDVVRPGDPKLEQEHGLRGENSSAGEFSGRHWRHATGGGWFSWELKVDPDTDQELLCAYWGSDIGREFDILVDGVKIATQKLQSNRPDRFFEEIYPLSAELIRGKSRITVQFQAHNGGLAGGVFECRTLKK